MATSIIYFRSTFFEYNNLTKLHGERTYDGVKRLYNELKANYQTVPSNVGAGNGHLGLVLSPVKYALLSNVPYIRSLHPGILVLVPGETMGQTVLLNRHT